jgi:ferritin
MTQRGGTGRPTFEEGNTSMALSDKVTSVLNEQINKELYSAYLYLTFADYYEERGLKGFANWYTIQVQEERDHAMALRRYLLDNDFTPKMAAIAEPDLTFDNDLAPLEAGLEHEEYITASIHHCYEVAQGEKDIRTMQMLDWFVKEQGEEETNARDNITNMKLFGSDPKGLFDLDREYQTRAYVAQTTLPM